MEYQRGNGLLGPPISHLPAPSPSGHCADNQEGFLATDDGVGQLRFGRFQGQVLLAGKESDKGTALECLVVADGAAQSRVARFEGVEDAADGRGLGGLELNVAIHTSEVAEVKWQDDADHLLT